MAYAVAAYALVFGVLAAYAFHLARERRRLAAQPGAPARQNAVDNPASPEV